MAYTPYLPRSRPMFRGDDWAELRDALHDMRADAMAVVAGRIAHHYLHAAVVMERETDRDALWLRRNRDFDLRCVMVAHGHLAAFWRYTNGYVHPTLPGIIELERLVFAFRDWVRAEASLWFIDQPILVRRFALALTRWDDGDIMLREMDLWEALKEHYPIPPPDQDDLFDRRATYSPYPV